MLNLLKSLGSKIILSKDKKTVKIINKKKDENFCKLFTCKNDERINFSFRSINFKIL